MNNKIIIEFGFRMILRIMQISRGLSFISSYHTQPHPIIANYPRVRMSTQFDVIVCRFIVVVVVVVVVVVSV